MKPALTTLNIKILLGASLAVLALSVVALLYSGWGVDQFGTPAAWFAALGTFSAVTLALHQSWKQEKQFTEELERQAKLREADKLARDGEVWSERIIELIELHERLLRTPSDFATWSRIRSLLVSIPAKYGRLLGEAVAIPRAPWIESEDENPRPKIMGDDYGVVDARLPQIELHANLRSLQGVPNVDILAMVTDYANAMRASSEWKNGADAVFKDVHARHFPTPRES
ncbi:hypothetical protein ACWFNS_07650 [Oerskovia enterophila]